MIPHMLVLGIETSCDETGIALYDTARGLLSHAVYSQVAMHEQYGGVVPELASRDHIRRLLPLTKQVLFEANKSIQDINAIAYTQGPGLAGTLLVGASIANSLAFALGIPIVGIHHLEGHLLSPMLSSDPPAFPFIALLVSGGHTQIMQVEDIGKYKLLGDTLDDAAGEAFDKTAKLLGLGYPGGPALAKLAEQGRLGQYVLPRPMLRSKDFNFSFSGLKTAVLSLTQKTPLNDQMRADLALGFECAIIEVLVKKAINACDENSLSRLVVAGGVGANKRLRTELNLASAKRAIQVFYPNFEFCTDNGAMIAYAGALKFMSQKKSDIFNRKTDGLGFTVKPRWNLDSID